MAATNNQSKKEQTPRKIKPQDLYPAKQPPKKKLSNEERSYKKEDNLASRKRELAIVRSQAEEKEESSVQGSVIDPDHMSPKELRKYKRQQEREKLSELSFWRKIQYILMYYSGKFFAIIAGILIIIFLIQRIYIATCPIVFDIVMINDSSNTTFESAVISLYSKYNEIPERGRFIVDTNMEFDPNSTEVTTDMTFYTKIGSVMTSNRTQVIICDPDIVSYYAVDGYLAELKNTLPSDLYEYYESRIYQCDGPYQDSNCFAIDLSNTKFAEMTDIHITQPMFCIPSCTDEENREIAINFLRTIMLLEEE